MLSYISKFLEISGLLLAGSGIIGDTRLRELEIFVRNQLKIFLSRKGFQDFLQRGSILAENQGTFFARVFSFLSLLFEYLSVTVSVILSLIAITALIFPVIRKIILELVMNNKELVIFMLKTGGYLLGFCVIGLFLSILSPTITKQSMIKPQYWFAKKTRWYFDNLQGNLESVTGKISDTLLKRIKLIPKPTNKWLRRLLYIPFVLLITIVLFTLIFIPLILWFGFWVVLSTITRFFVISLFFVSLSILQIVIISIFAIAYAIAGILFLPYAVLERSIKRVYPQLAPGSTFIIVGYILSIIGILLQ